MESFAGLGATLYALDAEGVRVDGFHPSTLDAAGLGVRVVQEGLLPASDTVTLRVEALEPAADARPGETGVTLRLRVPDWCARPELALDGAAVTPERDGGHVVLRDVRPGTTVTYRIPARVTAHPTGDEPSFVAFRYGPVVLSAGLGPADVDACEPTGILVRISDHDPHARDVLTLPAGTPVAAHLAGAPLRRLPDAADGTVRFAPHGTLDGDDLVYAPHHLRWDERYAIYLHVEEQGSPAARARADRAAQERRRAAATVDELTVFDGNNFENARAVRAERSAVGVFAGRTHRAAEPGGWFAYTLDADGATSLGLTLRPEDGPVTVTLDGAVTHRVAGDARHADPDGFVEVVLPLPGTGRRVEVRCEPATDVPCRVHGVRTFGDA
jgi:hypothetical protein